MTQDELAERVGVQRPTVSKWETGRAEPGIPEPFNKLCTALRLSPETLLEAMGVRLAPRRYERLPRELREILDEMSPDQAGQLLGFLRAWTKGAAPR